MTKIQVLSGLLLLLTACSHQKINAPTVPSAEHGLDFASFDENKDGAVSRAEYEARIPRKFKYLDRDRDGQFQPKREAPGRSHWSHQADYDKNGRISIIEFMRAADRAFERADENKDGKLSPTEFGTLELY